MWKSVIIFIFSFYFCVLLLVNALWCTQYARTDHRYPAKCCHHKTHLCAHKHFFASFSPSFSLDSFTVGDIIKIELNIGAMRHWPTVTRRFFHNFVNATKFVDLDFVLFVIGSCSCLSFQWNACIHHWQRNWIHTWSLQTQNPASNKNIFHQVQVIMSPCAHTA